MGMETAREYANSLYGAGYSDSEIGEASGVTRVYINMVRNGKKQGSEDLALILKELCEQIEQDTLPAPAPALIAHVDETEDRPPAIKKRRSIYDFDKVIMRGAEIMNRYGSKRQ